MGQVNIVGSLVLFMTIVILTILSFRINHSVRRLSCSSLLHHVFVLPAFEKAGELFCTKSLMFKGLVFKGISVQRHQCSRASVMLMLNSDQSCVSIVIAE